MADTPAINKGKTRDWRKILCKGAFILMFLVTSWYFYVNRIFNWGDISGCITQVISLAIFFYFFYCSVSLILSEIQPDKLKHTVIPVQAIVYMLFSAGFIFLIIYRFEDIVETNRYIFSLKIMGSGNEAFYLLCFDISFPILLLAFIANFCKSQSTITSLEYGLFAGKKHCENLGSNSKHISIDAILRLFTALLFILIEHMFSKFGEVAGNADKNQAYYEFIGKLKGEGFALYLSILLWLGYMYFFIVKKDQFNTRWWVFTFIQIVAGLGVCGSFFIFNSSDASPNSIAIMATLMSFSAVALLLFMLIIEFTPPIKKESVSTASASTGDKPVVNSPHES